PDSAPQHWRFLASEQSRPLRNRARQPAVRSSGPSFRIQRWRFADSFAERPRDQLPRHAGINFYRVEELFLRYAFFRGVRDVNVARSNQKWLAPGAGKIRNVRGVGNDRRFEPLQRFEV